MSVPEARTLAETDPYQFQWWVLDLLDARLADRKKGSDKGIDGRIYFHDDAERKTKQIIFSVKAGKLQPGYVRDLIGVLDREKAQIGVLVSMNEPTREMRKESASAGFYELPQWGKFPRIQLLTVEQIFAGKRVEYPRTRDETTYKKARRAQERLPEELELPLRTGEEEVF